MFVGPERRKQYQLACLGLHTEPLMFELGLATRAGNVIQIPDCHQLAIGKIVAATIDVPMKIIAWRGALQRIALIFEGASEKPVLTRQHLYGAT